MSERAHRMMTHPNGSYEASLQPTSIDSRFGFEWALCCGVGCKAPCNQCQCSGHIPLPIPPAIPVATLAEVAN